MCVCVCELVAAKEWIPLHRTLCATVEYASAVEIMTLYILIKVNFNLLNNNAFKARYYKIKNANQAVKFWKSNKTLWLLVKITLSVQHNTTSAKIVFFCHNIFHKRRHQQQQPQRKCICKFGFLAKAAHTRICMPPRRQEENRTFDLCPWIPGLLFRLRQ